MGSIKKAAELAEQIARISRDYNLEETTAAFVLFANDVLLHSPPEQYPANCAAFVRLLGGLTDSLKVDKPGALPVMDFDSALNACRIHDAKQLFKDALRLLEEI